MDTPMPPLLDEAEAAVVDTVVPTIAVLVTEVLAVVVEVLVIETLGVEAEDTLTPEGSTPVGIDTEDPEGRLLMVGMGNETTLLELRRS